MKSSKIGKSSPSFIVYIDESGDEGFAFERGSSKWFVLTGIVLEEIKKEKANELLRKVRKECKLLDKKALHARKLKEEKLNRALEIICGADLKIISIIFGKCFIEEEGLKEYPRLYHYITRFLLERVSWCCGDKKQHLNSGDGSARIIFSKRKNMNYKELVNYIRRLESKAEAYRYGIGVEKVEIDWNIINTKRIEAIRVSKESGLQIADIVANSFFRAIEQDKNINLPVLKPAVYCRNNKYLSYGIKIFPPEALETLKKREEWVNNYD